MAFLVDSPVAFGFWGAIHLLSQAAAPWADVLTNGTVAAHFELPPAPNRFLMQAKLIRGSDW